MPLASLTSIPTGRCPVLHAHAFVFMCHETGGASTAREAIHNPCHPIPLQSPAPAAYQQRRLLQVDRKPSSRGTAANQSRRRMGRGGVTGQQGVGAAGGAGEERNPPATGKATGLTRQPEARSGAAEEQRQSPMAAQHQLSSRLETGTQASDRVASVLGSRHGNFTLCKRVAQRLIHSQGGSRGGGEEESVMGAAVPCPYSRCPIQKTFVPELSGQFLATENFFYTAQVLPFTSASPAAPFFSLGEVQVAVVEVPQKQYGCRNAAVLVAGANSPGAV